jgi:hypothetical protein
VRTPPSEKKCLYKPGEWTFRQGPMIVDVQQVVAGYMFTGRMHEITTPPSCQSGDLPSGSWRSVCNVPLDIAKGAQISRKFRKVFLEWREREMEKMMDDMFKKAVEKAFDLCDRECYPVVGAVPVLSTVVYTLEVQRQDVVLLEFVRHGTKKKHCLTATVMAPVACGWVKTSDMWMKKTPRSSWKFMSQLRGQELVKWQTWEYASRLELLAWIREQAWWLMDPFPTITHSLSHRPSQ